MSPVNLPPPIKALIATPETPQLGPGPRAHVCPVAELNARLDAFLEGVELPLPNRQLIRATVLLWHDHFDTAHGLAQEIESADGSYVHGILHRREPDYGNAKYWFHRVGTHPSFVELAAKGAGWLQDDRELESKLIPRGLWDPFAYVDACERVARRPASDGQTRRLRDLQAVELEILLARFCQ